MDDRRIFAEIERRLARDDPALASLLDALNQQFIEDDSDGVHDEHRRRDWRWVTAVVLVVVALLAMILTAVFAAPPPTEGDKGRLDGRVPAVSVHTQRRDQRARTHHVPVPGTGTYTVGARRRKSPASLRGSRASR
ncbi:DUF3040 domain-containing protein [Streptomyces sp. NPDC019443]|uniref:DUF3040 domain-containing protein n=1 Tax=Streptomyces sp. NPDC019443 TaxID=3365061 RepID=UPI0037B950E1